MQNFLLPSSLKCLSLECSKFSTFIWKFWWTKVKTRVIILITFCQWWNCYPYFWICNSLEKLITFLWQARNINNSFGRNKKELVASRENKFRRYIRLFPIKYFRGFYSFEFCLIKMKTIHTNHVRLSFSYQNHLHHQVRASKDSRQIRKPLIVYWQKKTLSWNTL